MLNSLRLENFQVFQRLELEGLRRINLISGKNNTGKTILLEALRIFLAEAEPTVVNSVLKSRGHFYPSRSKIYVHLFNRFYVRNTEGELRLSINDLTITSREYRKHYDANFHGKKTYLDADKSPDFPEDQAVFVPLSAQLEHAKQLWSEISLTPEEDEVFGILQQTVEPGLVRFDFVNSGVKVRLKEEPLPVPLASLGDGVKRILHMALALVSARGKLLLIDEFEAGLHHSVQERLWELVFHYARRWDIQLFVTTHSEDTVRSFYYVGSKPDNVADALFLRLQYDRDGRLGAHAYNMKRLGQALELNLETR